MAPSVAGLAFAAKPAMTRTTTTRPRRQPTASSPSGTSSSGAGGAIGWSPFSGAPVLGSVAATTAKHSEVAFVCVAGANTPVLPASGAYTLRQQYMPAAELTGVGSEVAAPATSVLTAPTCAPPAGQPAAVTAAGPQREKVMLPVGAGPAPPVGTLAASAAVSPGATVVPAGAVLVAVAGSRHRRHAAGPSESLP